MHHPAKSAVARPALWAAGLLLAAVASTSVAQSINVSPDHADGVYAVGDRVHWTVKASGVDGPLTYTVAPNQGKPTKTGTLGPPTDPGDPADITTTFDKPSTVLVKVTGKAANGKEVVGIGGVIAGADRIQLSATRPADFDAFWAAKVKELEAIPADPVLTPGDAGKPGVAYAQLTMANIHGSHIEAQVARPEKGEKFPAVLIVQWAGVYGLQKTWVTERAADGWLALDVMPHDLPIDRPADFYKAQTDGALKNYWAIGNDDRETSYYLRMYLSCYRAVQYLKSRPDWDGKTLVVMGGSQGGMQSLMTAGLCAGDITAALADVPAGCDMLGPDVGRRGGWPQWYEWTHGADGHHDEDAAKVHEASRYFDVANFAPLIRCPVLVGTGLIDETCPAAGVVAACNLITAPKEVHLMPVAAHQSYHNSHGPFDKRQNQAWMPALLKGQPAPVQQ